MIKQLGKLEHAVVSIKFLLILEQKWASDVGMSHIDKKLLAMNQKLKLIYIIYIFKILGP